MKIIVFLAGLALASSALADIHDPPSNDYGPTRKLGRGFANFFLAPAEIPVTIATVNTNEGNSAAAGYGVVGALDVRRRDTSPACSKFCSGLCRLIGKAIIRYCRAISVIHAGYAEFPPELGNDEIPLRARLLLP